MKEVLKGSLEGIKVIDFSTLLPGPLASLFLSETGAEVIKIEKPDVGDEIRLSNPQWGEQSVSFSLLNRGKKSLSLDLKDPKNLKILIPILKEADIIIEQFRPGVMKRLGLDYENINKINKNINTTHLPKNKISNKFYYSWFLFLAPGFILGMLNAFNIELNFNFIGINVIEIMAFILAIYCVLLWVLNPLTDIQMASIHENSYRKVVDTTCFVTVWVIISFVVYELIDLSTNGLIFESLILFGPFIPLMAILIGFIPGCGPQIMITSMYVSGQIPMSAQIGNSISNDGDALFPAIAISAKAAIVATLYSAIPAIIIAYLWYYLIG